MSSKRRLHLLPSFSAAIPKFRHIDVAWPICKNPFGSGGNLVTIEACFPDLMSSLTISLMKSSDMPKSLFI